jgi:hypothetical protein
MSQPTRFLSASLMAPLPAAVLIALISAAGFLYLSSISVSALDDGPMRSAGAIFILSPIVYLLGAAVLYVATRGMAVVGVLTKRSLLVAASVASLVLGLAAAVADPFGPRDAAISATIFSAVAFALAGPTCLLWWRCSLTFPSSRLPSAATEGRRYAS